MSVYYKNNKGNEGKGNTKHIAHQTRATAGNVLITLIPEFNTLEVPGGSVAYVCKNRTNEGTAGVDELVPLTH